MLGLLWKSALHLHVNKVCVCVCFRQSKDQKRPEMMNDRVKKKRQAELVCVCYDKLIDNEQDDTINIGFCSLMSHWSSTIWLKSAEKTTSGPLKPKEGFKFAVCADVAFTLVSLFKASWCGIIVPHTPRRYTSKDRTAQLMQWWWNSTAQINISVFTMCNVKGFDPSDEDTGIYHLTMQR